MSLKSFYIRNVLILVAKVCMRSVISNIKAFGRSTEVNLANGIQDVIAVKVNNPKTDICEVKVI